MDMARNIHDVGNVHLGERAVDRCCLVVRYMPDAAEQAYEPAAVVVAVAPTAVPSLAKNARSARVIGRPLGGHHESCFR